MRLLQGSLSNGTDEDWFVYGGHDGDFCAPNPSGQVTATNGNTPLRLCIYLECLSGDTDLTCPSGADPSTSDDGDPGCCSTAAMSIDDYDCTGTIDESARVYMRVDDPTNSAPCTSYELTWHF